ncbi:ureidoglycolate lyase [Siccirubricoccus sp. KC 17139]|uniref:Ureidoglycolate lyase n=1 Tax=Siccirubricoccus soli TaxID=2899147 RepID=A0ABT1DDT6_9PROT|nr:ureidoglycolate lyase [Siccirubricoccus soli]MCO6419369.1 ureidoglycolate lyase [Siccirubricoccus soli]MCP2685504.1 ureidoglycolate lyase [Siccirubricoccus soli]
MILRAEPLTSAAFLPFGEVIECPEVPGRTYFEDALANLRPGARPSISLTVKAPLTALPLRSTTMERHEFSSQSFIPQEGGRWLAIVAPHAADARGGAASNSIPDMARARAFLCGPRQGVTYGANVWHHPFTVLDREARFVIVMWRDGTKADEEFVEVPPFEVELPAGG